MFAGILLVVLVFLLVMAWCLTAKTKFDDWLPAAAASLLTAVVGTLAIGEIMGGDKVVFALPLLITTFVGGTVSLINVVIFANGNIKVESVTQVLLGSYVGMFMGLLGTSYLILGHL